MSSISTERIEQIIIDSLFREGEDTSRRIEAHGVVTKFGFHPERLESHAAEIEAMLEHLPATFKESEGGGWSFLNACMDDTGEQWGEHLNIDKLLCLGIAIGKARILLPREVWYVLPGGMPYFVVLSQREPRKEQESCAASS